MELHQYEKSDYPYSVTARRESISKNKEILETIRRESYGTTLKEALTSDTLSGFIPDLFIDEIIQLGLRTATARNMFPVISQSTHGSFKQRYRFKDEGVQVTGRELTEVKATQSEREIVEFSFLKLSDANVMSLEFLEDSTLEEATAEIQLSASKFFRRENQLTSHRLIEFSEGTTATKWANYVSGIDAGGTDADLITSLETAFLDITTKLTDAFPVESLTWIVTPTVFARLFRNADFRRFDILGGQPNLVTGKIAGTNSIFRIPIQIMEIGYFSDESVWTPTPYDIFLSANQFSAAIRERWSMRTTPLDQTKIMAQSMLLFERLTPYVRNPFAIRRISPTQNYTDMIGSMDSIHIIAGKDDTTVFPAT